MAGWSQLRNLLPCPSNGTDANTVCQSLDCMFWGKKEAYKLGFLLLSILAFIYLFFLFFPLILPAINGKTNGIMSKSVNTSALQVQAIKSVS